MQNRIKATNQLNKYINKTIPLIMEVLKDGIELKKDGSLFKKQQDKIDNIIGYDVRPKNIRCYIDSSIHSAWLRIDIRYDNESDQKFYSSSYIKDHAYLWTNKTDWNVNKKDWYIIETKISDSFQKRPIKTINQVSNVIKKTDKLKNKISLLNEQIIELEKDFKNYLIK
tara:strand:+ start:153 stop:659 length:507 start_codon:yes stop_codon:yes gene_type:complete